MRNEYWEKIQELFLAAADMAPDAQRSFLDDTCAENPGLRHEVESLLASDTGDGECIAAAVAGAAEDLLGGDPLIGTRLGRWRVEREIGRGGMGAVYLATRDDGDYRQQAAIKLVKEGMDTAHVLDHFRHERQILANLNHPYIARLIDGGSTEQDRPYLVMEYVEGRPIDAWLRDRGAGLEERCRLFLRVCEAVSYAHRLLVVHRDLKPGNILIAPGGLPKLLDFGVAQLLAPDDDPDIAAAAPDSRALTPGYASPEQFLGQPVTTATDVYSLGAILYELLTGRTAYGVGPASAGEWRRAVCETEPARPSDAVQPDLPGAARLRRGLRGDLDNIVLMAMRRQPERRYASVDELAADLRRYLEGLPVVASRDSLVYRAGKFARRHALGLAMAGLAAASLLAGTALAVIQARRAEAARRMADVERHAAVAASLAAERERIRAESQARLAGDEARVANQRLTQMVALANHSLFDIHSRIERLPGATEARREIVGTTLQYLQNLRKAAGDDERLLQALASAYFKLGDVQGYPFGPSLGDAAGAMASYRAASRLLEPLRKRRPRDAEILDVWVQLQDRIGLLLATAGKVDEATACLRGALADAALLAQLRPDDAEAASREGELFESMAGALETRDTQAALAWSKRGLAVFEALAARFPAREEILDRLADAHARTGMGWNMAGNLQAAMTEFRLCAEVRERLLSAHPNDVARRRSLMMAYGHTAAVLGDPLVPNLGDFEGAREYYRKAAELAGQIARADPRNGTAQYDVAAVTLRLGLVNPPPSGLEESLATLRQAEAELEPLVRAAPNDSRYKSQLAIAREYIGERLRTLGRLPESIAAYRQSLAGADSALAADPANRSAYAQSAASSGGLVRALAGSGERAEALAAARAAIARAEACGTHSPEKAACARYQATAWLTLGTAYRILAQSAGTSPEERAADRREAQAAGQRAAGELSAIPAANCDSRCRAILEEARSLAAGQP